MGKLLKMINYSIKPTPPKDYVLITKYIHPYIYQKEKYRFAMDLMELRLAHRNDIYNHIGIAKVNVDENKNIVIGVLGIDEEHQDKGLEKFIYDYVEQRFELHLN